jgi:hypothetical protein
MLNKNFRFLGSLYLSRERTLQYTERITEKRVERRYGMKEELNLSVIRLKGGMIKMND